MLNAFPNLSFTRMGLWAWPRERQTEAEETWVTANRLGIPVQIQNTYPRVTPVSVFTKVSLVYSK